MSHSNPIFTSRGVTGRQLPLICFRSGPTFAAPLIFNGVLKNVGGAGGGGRKDGVTRGEPEVPMPSLGRGPEPQPSVVEGDRGRAWEGTQTALLLSHGHYIWPSSTCSLLPLPLPVRKVSSARNFPRRPSTDGNFRSILPPGENFGVTTLLT